MQLDAPSLCMAASRKVQGTMADTLRFQLLSTLLSAEDAHSREVIVSMDAQAQPVIWVVRNP
jgi:hypothetical protein